VNNLFLLGLGTALV